MIAVVIIVSLAVNGKTEKEEVNTTVSYSSSVIKFTNAAETTQSISKWQNSSNLTTQQSPQVESTKNSEVQSKVESKSENSEHEQSQEPNENSINNSSHNSSQSNNNYYRPQQSETPKPEPTKVQEPQTTKKVEKQTSKPTVKPQETTKDNIYLSYSSVSIHTDDVLFLNLIGADNGVSWSVGNSYILQNYGGGGNQCSFKALKKGSTTVTATYNGRSYTCYVTVN
jgi:FtsZ-interacting cell division protein ZipA